MKTELVVGSRGSVLARRQTDDVVTRLRAAHPSLAIRVTPIRTAADSQPQQPFARLGGIGFFVKELEVALLDCRIDAAVHSMKDLPTDSQPGLVIAAVPPREDPRDVLVARDGGTLDSLPPAARVGTSSPRRGAALRAVRPDLVVVPVRGNIETRIRQVDDGRLDAVCLAAAGLLRCGLVHRITDWLPVHRAIPAPGQGALAVQVRAGDRHVYEVVRVLDHAPTRQAVLAERAVLRRMQGGCRLPLGVLAEADGDRLRLRAAVIAPDGSRVIDGGREGSVDDAEALGTALAEELLAHGAAALLPAGTEASR